MNPWQISSPNQGQRASDPLSHIAKVEQSVAGGKVVWMSLSLRHETSWHYFLAPLNMAKPIANNEVYVDPCSGDIKGMRSWGEITQGWKNLLPFIYKLHYSLSLRKYWRFGDGISRIAVASNPRMWGLDDVS